MRKSRRRGGHRFFERGRALFIAAVILVAFALAAAGVVIADNINGSPGYEVLNGTPGNDVIDARDGGPDTIDCGAGNDTVYVDRSEDGVVNCETVITP